MLLFDEHRERCTTTTHKPVVYSIAFSPDSSALATGAKDGSVFVRDGTGQVCPLFQASPKNLAVYAIGYLPDGCGVIVGGEFGWVHWQFKGHAWEVVGPPAVRPVTSLAVVSERMVAFGIGQRFQATAGTFELWDITTARKLTPYFHEPNGVQAIAACPAKKLVAWMTGHRQVRVYDITSPKPIDFPQPKDCRSIALSADGRLLAVAVDCSVRVYDIEKHRELHTLKGFQGPVAAVAFSPDGRLLLTGSWDGSTRLWDTATGTQRAAFHWNIGRVLCVAYAPDGLRLAAGGDRGHVVVWDAE
ncbi:MAG: hypothetical protein RMJ56_04180 [Gemmataceae bacterium]|nr:hypothetical protein [Gemmata sp.]MDW8196787.1 hypothetical protein [Gemmataceae bacterium]